MKPDVSIETVRAEAVEARRGLANHAEQPQMASSDAVLEQKIVAATAAAAQLGGQQSASYSSTQMLT